jgi:hypothetical protein
MYFDRQLIVRLFALQKAARSGLDPMRKYIFQDI